MKPDFRGARGSNAGDDFHELWALRQALSLLDPETELTAVTVEGLRAEDEKGVPADTWDGVDCTSYYGGNDVASTNKIVIDQLKYSAADPRKKWSVARLTQSTKKTGNNSVLRKLTKAFVALAALRPDLVGTKGLQVRLVSNQPVDPSVSNALRNAGGASATRERNRARLRAASGLSESEFDNFARSFDLSQCGQSSRFAIEERVLTTIASWTEDDARVAVEHLLWFIRKRMMMPEGKGEYVTGASILAELGFGDLGAIFPCPSAIRRLDRFISREEAKKTTDYLLNGSQRVCFHGAGGCGKTTLLQEIETLLPSGSVMVTYDCYGGGRYLDSDAYRHRPSDAFRQLSNELARELRIPYLFTKSGALDYPRAFMKRLQKAAEVVAAQSGSALLVIAADAVDNSITAANTHSPPEPSFVHGFVGLGKLPPNVRLIVTCRTGSLPALDLKGKFGAPVEVKGFSPAETRDYVQTVWSRAPQNWIEDFHHFSDGNPRVQTYALDYAKDDRQLALDYLRPHGKDLDKIFQEQLQHARSKVGPEIDMQALCAAFANLPRPIPLEAVAETTSLTSATVTDLCRDLAPGIRFKENQISFADEDFEHFLRAEGEGQAGVINARIANYFVSHRTSSEYAASHVAAGLLKANRGREVLDLINTEREPAVITDPVSRRRVQLERFKIATKVCRDSGNVPDALLTVLIGAEALKTDAAIRKILVENADLAAHFARDTVSRMILRDADEVENHGPLLFHLMAVDARRGDSVSVREGHRQVDAWMQRRKDYFAGEEHPHGWPIEISDIVAEIEALLRSASAQMAVDRLFDWHPKSLLFEVATELANQLISRGEADLVRALVDDRIVRSPWDLFLLTPLAVAGQNVELGSIETSLEKLLGRGLINLDRLQPPYREQNPVGDYLEIIVTACEIVAARGGDTGRIVPVLEALSREDHRRSDKLHTFDTTRIDITFRAHALLHRLNGGEATVSTYLVPAPPLDQSLPEQQLKRAEKRREEDYEQLQRFVATFASLYDARARLLIGTQSTDPAEHLDRGVSVSRQEDYRLRNEFHLFGMRTQAALAVTRLTMVQQLDPKIVYEQARAALGPNSGPFNDSEAKVFTNLAVVSSLHQRLLEAGAQRVDEIRKAKVSADEKISALVRFARLLKRISDKDAEAVFNEAVTVSGEVNVEAIWELGTLAPIAERAADGVDADQRKSVAAAIAAVVSDAAIRLEGQDGFPWSKIGRALANLHIGPALAATARWQDSATIDIDTVLPSILKAALKRKALSGQQVVAFLPLLDSMPASLIELLAEQLRQSQSADADSMIEEIAKEELLRFGNGRREEVSAALQSASGSAHGRWLKQLLDTTTFAKQLEDDKPGVVSNDLSTIQRERDELLNSVNWNNHRFVDAAEINVLISSLLAKAKDSDTFISVTEILLRMGESVALSDRVAHLEALLESETTHIGEYELGRVMPRWIEEWGSSPAVSKWNRERLPSVIRKLLPAFVHYLAYDQSPLQMLLTKTGASEEETCAALLDAIAAHTDNLDAQTVYSLVGLTSRYCTSSDAALVLHRYVDRLLQRIAVADRDIWEVSDIPNDSPSAVARFLFALAGDVDVRNRWRSGHAIRCLARLNETQTLNEFSALYERTSDALFRRSDAPFYWLAARLWLMISFDRIAHEQPKAIRQLGRWLVDIATADDFPHVLVRSFAKSAAEELVNSGDLVLSAADWAKLTEANTSSVARQKPASPTGRAFDRYHYKRNEERRFHFDTMDTLPYWYSSAISAFADVDREKFLDIAEKWIVDHWNITNNPWEWSAEPRQNRFSERQGQSMDHSHGSLPTLERFHTYLEWHAMWCAIGELMRTEPLAKLESDDYDRLESKLARNHLTVPPLWLTDLRGAKPLEWQFWTVPTDVEKWMEEAPIQEFLTEVLPSGDKNSINVDGHHETRSRAFRLSVRVKTALVSPETAPALARAFQTAKDYRYYDIPKAGDESEIDEPPFELRGWLESGYHDAGIDERDPHRYDIDYVHSKPSRTTVAGLGLKKRYDLPTVQWLTNQTSGLTYHAWGDSRWDYRDDRLRYDDNVTSSGTRLLVPKDLLKHYLAKRRRDLIAEIRVTKRNKGYYDYSDEEKAKEKTFIKILLFRKDGTLEDATGRIGTWTSSG